MLGVFAVLINVSAPKLKMTQLLCMRVRVCALCETLTQCKCLNARVKLLKRCLSFALILQLLGERFCCIMMQRLD